MSLRVVDLNTDKSVAFNSLPSGQSEEAKEEEPKLEAIEEATKEEVKEEEQTAEPEAINEVVNEEVKEEKPKPKRQTQRDRIQCPKCLKEMTVKSFRYSHEKNCGGQLSEKPVKPHTKPKPKPKPKQVHEVLSNKRNPKPPPDVHYSESDDDDDEPQQPLIKSKKNIPKQPSNPLLDITNQYALLHQQLMHQKQEKYNKVCAGMFGPRTKKR